MPQDEKKWTANSMIGAPVSPLCLFPCQSTTLVFPAGAGGGLVASIATCPLDVVKTKLQAQRAVHGQPGYQGVLGSYAPSVIADFMCLITHSFLLVRYRQNYPET